MAAAHIGTSGDIHKHWKGRFYPADVPERRRHSSQRPGSGERHSRHDLARDAAWIRRELADGRDVFVYFNNDEHGDASANASELIQMIRHGR